MVRRSIYVNADKNELLLRVDLGADGSDRECKAYGFRKGDKGTFTLPLAINEDLVDALDRIAKKVEAVTPVYRSDDGCRVYAKVVMTRGGIVFSNIYDSLGTQVKPKDKVDSVMDVRGVIRVDSVFFGLIPRVQISLIEAELTDTEIVREKLL